MLLNVNIFNVGSDVCPSSSRLKQKLSFYSLKMHLLHRFSHNLASWHRVSISKMMYIIASRIILRLLIVSALVFGIFFNGTDEDMSEEMKKHLPNAAATSTEKENLQQLSLASWTGTIAAEVDAPPLSTNFERKTQSADKDAHFFEIQIAMKASSRADCGYAESALIDKDINELLVKHGVGDLGNTVGGDPTPVSAPCLPPKTAAPSRRPTLRPTPAPTRTPTLSPTHTPTLAPTLPPGPTEHPWTSAPTRRPTPNPTRRPTPHPTASPYTPLALYGYTWNGAGGCRFCGFDKWDARRIQEANVDTTTTAAEKLSALLTDELQNIIAPKYRECLGSRPSIRVDVIEVTPADVDLYCGRETQSPTEAVQEECNRCRTLDFAKKLDGTDLINGDRLRKREYLDAGVRIIVSRDGNKHRQKGHIFDTSNPGTSNANGYPQLGSPNSECIPGGLDPGVGDGGKPGQAGENCKPIGSKWSSTILLVYIDCKLLFLTLIVFHRCADHPGWRLLVSSSQ